MMLPRRHARPMTGSGRAAGSVCRRQVLPRDGGPDDSDALGRRPPRGAHGHGDGFVRLGVDRCVALRAPEPQEDRECAEQADQREQEDRERAEYPRLRVSERLR